MSSLYEHLCVASGWYSNPKRTRKAETNRQASFGRAAALSTTPTELTIFVAECFMPVDASLAAATIQPLCYEIAPTSFFRGQLQFWISTKLRVVNSGMVVVFLGPTVSSARSLMRAAPFWMWTIPWTRNCHCGCDLSLCTCWMSPSNQSCFMF